MVCCKTISSEYAVAVCSSSFARVVEFNAENTLCARAVPREMAIKGHDILYVDRSHEIKGSIYFEDEFEQINCEKLAFGYVWLLTCNDPHYVHVAMDMLPALCALEKKVGPRTQKGQKLKIHIEAMRKVMRTNHAYR